MTGRFLPRRGRVPLLLLCLLCAMPAWAETYYFCAVTSVYGDKRGFYYTPIQTTSIERIDEQKTGSAYAQWLQENGRRIPVGTYSPGCVSSPNADYVRKEHGQYPTWYPGVVLVDWPGPPIPEKPRESLPSGPYIIIEEAESYVIPAEVLEAQRLADERKRAAVLARILAQQAMRDAELDAMMREANERARRRGRMQ